MTASGRRMYLTAPGVATATGTVRWTGFGDVDGDGAAGAGIGMGTTGAIGTPGGCGGMNSGVGWWRMRGAAAVSSEAGMNGLAVPSRDRRWLGAVVGLGDAGEAA